MIKRGFRIILFLFLFVFTSCGQYHKIVKSKDNDLKYKSAIEYYEIGKFYRAINLFEDLKAVYKGTAKDEEIHYMIADAYYKQNDYMLASYYYDEYIKNFPQSERIEELKFMSAYCYYLDSPKYSLDQANTVLAMRKLQLFINQYPGSSRMEECNNLIDDLRLKLEKKAYETANLYFKISDYQAAVVALETVLHDFPETKFREEIMFSILKANYIFASNSIAERQTERFAAVLKAYDNLIIQFPETSHLKEAGNIYQDSLKYKTTEENGL
jgi:outer membrane protein assembly factor BamD